MCVRHDKQYVASAVNHLRVVLSKEDIPTMATAMATSTVPPASSESMAFFNEGVSTYASTDKGEAASPRTAAETAAGMEPLNFTSSELISRCGTRETATLFISLTLVNLCAAVRWDAVWRKLTGFCTAWRAMENAAAIPV